MTGNPVRKKPYPVSFALEQTVKDEVTEMLTMNTIEPSDSPYSSQYILIKRKNDTNKFVLDFRELNKITVFDAEPMPNIDQMLAK